MSFPELSGDPSQLKVYATRYLNLADAIRNASATLKAVGDNNDGTLSLAVDAIRGKAKKGATSIGQAENRYRTTAAALGTYATALEEAQEKAAEARSEYEAASGSHASAESKAQDYEDRAGVPGESQAADSRSFSTWTERAGEFASAMTAAQSKYDAAVAAKEAAGNTAADAIEQVVSDDDLSDNWWDKLVDFCEKIGDWVAIAALLLSWVPILGQILLAVSALISIIKLIDSLIKFANGEMTLGEVIGAAVGVVLSVLGGKALMAAIKGLRAMRTASKLSKLTKKLDNLMSKANSQTKSKSLRNARNRADKANREALKDLRDTFGPKSLGKELADSATKPFKDLKDSFKTPPEASDFLRALTEGKDGTFAKLLQQGDVTDFSKALRSMDWSDMPASLRAEVILEGTKVFGGAAQTLSAPFVDVPLTIDSFVSKGSDAAASKLADIIDAR